MRLHKPVGILLLLWPTLWSLMLTRSHSITLYIVFILEVILTRSAGCIINDYADYAFDQLVQRTHNRPIASGAVSKQLALFIFSVLLIVAFVLAVCYLKLLVILESLIALLLLITYPYAKRWLAIPQIYLGVTYSFCVVMVFTQMNQLNSKICYLLFFANFFWVIGYDIIYSMLDVVDDRKLNIYSAAKTCKQYTGYVIMVCYALFVLLMLQLSHNALYLLTIDVGALVFLCYALYLFSRQKYQLLFDINGYIVGPVFTLSLLLVI